MSILDTIRAAMAGGQAPSAPPQALQPGAVTAVSVGADPVQLTSTQESILRDLCLQEYSANQWSRRYDVRLKFKGREYWKGNQFPVWDNAIGGYVPYQQVLDSSTQGVVAQAANEQDSMRVFNIYRQTGRIMVSVLSGQLPTVRFWPADANVADDLATAKMGSDFAEVFERQNNWDMQLQDEAWYFYNDGFFGAYVRYVIDGQRFGFSTEPVMESVPVTLQPEHRACLSCGAPELDVQSPVCRQCGGPTGDVVPAQTAMVPQQIGTRQVPKGGVVYFPVGGLELQVPPEAREQSEFEYLRWSVELNQNELSAMYPALADKFRGLAGSDWNGGGDVGEDLERWYRTTTKNQTSGQAPVLLLDDQGNKVTYTQTWLRPQAFWRLPNTSDRDGMLALFPNGVRVAVAGGVFCEATAESMDDCWYIAHAFPGPGQLRESIGDILLDVQDVVNDLANLEVDVARRAITTLFTDTRLWNQAAIAQTRLQPGRIIPVTRTSGEAIGSSFYESQPSRIAEQTVNLRREMMTEVTQSLSGALPAMAGGTDPNIRTASGYRMARDQGLGQIGIVWRSLKAAHVAILTLAFKAFIKNQQEDVTFTVQARGKTFSSKTIRLQDARGAFIARPDSDEEFPVSPADRRQILFGFFNLAPDNPFYRAVVAPENMDLVKGLLAPPGLKMPGELQTDKQYREIEELLKAQPIQEPMLLPDGQPMLDQMGQPVMGPPQPSVPIDDVYDDHQVEFATVQQWMWEPEAAVIRVSNPGGYQNVWLHGQAHKMAMQQAQGGPMGPGNGPMGPPGSFMGAMPPVPAPPMDAMGTPPPGVGGAPVGGGL